VPGASVRQPTEGDLLSVHAALERWWPTGLGADEGYIHFVGVDPALRKQGLAQYLYEWFFGYCRAHGRSTVRAITSPGNAGSHAFHTAMGFTTEPGRLSFEGRPVQPDYDGPGMHRVSFVRSIA
jgi:GNAT superfamily N-acetyltransferase